MTKALRAGQAALALGAWEEARSWFLVAVEDHETGEALEGLARAAWWLNDPVVSFASREQAYRLYRQAKDTLSAGRVALHLGIDHCSLRDAYVVGHGWLQRAERLLDGVDPAAEHGWLALWMGQIAMIVGDDSAIACRHSADAADLARSLGLVPLEKLAMAQEAVALVRQGNVAPPVRLGPDMGAAPAADLGHLDLVITTCSQLMRAWEQVRDFDAVEKWWAVLDGVSLSGPPPCLLSLCRIHNATALVWRGSWDQAEAELEASVQALSAIRGEMAAEAMVRLAKMYRYRGRYQESAALLEVAESQPLRVPTEAHLLLGWAALALDDGDPPACRTHAERALDSLGGAHPGERLEALELLVSAAVASGKRDRARGALAELQRATCSLATDGVAASTRLAEGMVAVAEGVLDAARSRLEVAVELFERTSAPFETALARTELAVALSGLGQHDAARAQAATAMDTLCAVGAAVEADRAEARLPRRDPNGQAQAEQPAPAGSLTGRELDVLAVVAQGRSNHAIAAEMILSVRTVERHLSNIYAKIGVSGKAARAAAVAYGLRHGLLSG